MNREELDRHLEDLKKRTNRDWGYLGLGKTFSIPLHPKLKATVFDGAYIPADDPYKLHRGEQCGGNWEGYHYFAPIDSPTYKLNYPVTEVRRKVNL